MHDADPYETNIYMAEEISKLGLLYTHWIEPRIANATGDVDEEYTVQDSLLPFRKAFTGVFIASGGHTAESGELRGFGSLYIYWVLGLGLDLGLDAGCALG